MNRVKENVKVDKSLGDLINFRFSLVELLETGLVKMYRQPLGTPEQIRLQEYYKDNDNNRYLGDHYLSLIKAENIMFDLGKAGVTKVGSYCPDLSSNDGTVTFTLRENSISYLHIMSFIDYTSIAYTIEFYSL